jgi:hypothetical protein
VVASASTARLAAAGSGYTGQINYTVRCFTILALLLTCEAHASACTLRLPPSLQSLRGRIAAFDLEIRHGAIASLRTPVGWELKVNNDPSWNTKIGGHALVGAAFLQLGELPD